MNKKGSYNGKISIFYKQKSGRFDVSVAVLEEKVPLALRQGGDEIHSYNLIKRVFKTNIVISFGSSLIINWQNVKNFIKFYYR